MSLDLMDFLNNKAAEENLLEAMKRQLDQCRAALFYIQAIQDTINKEEAEVFIECLIDLDMAIFRRKKEDVLLSIRKGLGDYGTIKEKCIEWGLV
jgi:hypothetical protein